VAARGRLEAHNDFDINRHSGPRESSMRIMVASLVAAVILAPA